MFAKIMSVSGKFRTMIQVGDKQIAKCNAIIYGSILDGHLIDIGLNKLCAIN